MAKVLLVGDDIAAIDLMATSIEGLGYEAITLYESIDTVEAVVTEEIDLVILEENMNVFNGFEIAEQLKGDPDVPNELPVLMMTTNKIKPQDLEHAQIEDTILPEIELSLLREVLVSLLGE
jgi:CheY-like chemotaxis protein